MLFEQMVRDGYTLRAEFGHQVSVDEADVMVGTDPRVTKVNDGLIFVHHADNPDRRIIATRDDYFLI